MPIEIFEASKFISKASCVFGCFAERCVNSMNKNKANNCAADDIAKPIVELVQTDARP